MFGEGTAIFLGSCLHYIHCLFASAALRVATDGGFISPPRRAFLFNAPQQPRRVSADSRRGSLGVEFKRSNYFVAAVGSAATTLNFTSRQLPLSFGSHTFMSRFSIFAWNVPGSNMSFGLSGTSS